MSENDITKIDAAPNGNPINYKILNEHIHRAINND